MSKNTSTEITKDFIKKNLLDIKGKLSSRKLKIYNIKETPEELYCIYNDIEPVKCKMCNKKSLFKTFSLGYREHCSKECSQKNPERTKKGSIKRKAKMSEIIKKMKDTCLEKYGTEYYLSSDKHKKAVYKKREEISLKIQEHFIDKENSSDIKEKLNSFIKSSLSNNIILEYHLLEQSNNKFNHLNKTISCEEKGIQLFHINEDEWLNPVKKQIWISMIRGKQNLNKRIFARKCTIKEIDSKTARKFLEQNHLQGYSSSKIKIGLYFNDVLVQVMTFGKPRFNKKYEYELIRFASKKHLSIVGGGSKLLKYFERKYKPKNLLSYANRRWSKGDFYEKVGFQFIEDTKPGYSYTKKGVVYSRFQFQKQILKDKLDIFDEDKSEKENMFINGYRRIWDSGNKVYIKTYKS